MPVTIKQIAELAQVSRGTVDKVINNRSGVKAETREKVQKIIHELNYQPNYIGKALVNSNNPKKIGIILTPEDNQFIQEMIDGIHSAQAELRPLGIEIIIKIPLTLEPAEQLSIVNDLINNGCLGIGIFPIDDAIIKKKINQLVEEGIAIITFNSKIENTNELCFVGQNHHKGGRTAADLLHKLSPAGGDVGIIISSYNLTCHQDRLRGFLEKNSELKHPFNIVSIEENTDRKDLAFKISLELLNKNPNLTAIYITSGGIAGVGSCFSMFENKDKPFLVCHDLVPDTMELLKNGVVDFALGQNPKFQGYQIAKLLSDYLIKNELPESSILEIPITIATKESF